ncbi:MAG: molybdopterin-binding protein [Actinomycetota bacterium]
MRVGEFASALLSMATPLAPLDMPLLDSHGATLSSDVLSEGRVVLAEGVRIRSTQIGLAATLGLDHLPTRPQPRVVVVALSDDTAMTSAAATNSWLLTTAVKEAGALGYRVLLQADTAAHTKAIIEDQLVRADLLVVTGDEGDRPFEHVLDVLSRIGQMESVDVRYLRGGRHAYGAVGPEKTPVLLLPGNPIAAYISTEIFVRPMIRQMMGLNEIHRPVIRARLETDLQSLPDYHEFLLATWSRRDGGDFVRALDDQESMVALAEANALIAISADDEKKSSGSEVDVILLERRYL